MPIIRGSVSSNSFFAAPLPRVTPGRHRTKRWCPLYYRNISRGCGYNPSTIRKIREELMERNYGNYEDFRGCEVCVRPADQFKRCTFYQRAMLTHRREMDNG
jgi:hypothetical protein